MFDSKTMLSIFKNKKFGFTLIETIMVLSLFSLVVIGIIGAINRSYTFLSKTKLQVRATNLAREGVEQMFIIRNSNRRKWSGLKDEHWLDVDIRNDNSITFNPGLYSIIETGCTAGTCIVAKGILTGNNDMIKKCYSEDRFFKEECEGIKDQTKVAFTGTYTYFSGDDHGNFVPVTEDLATLLGGETDFYRLVRIFGVYNKDTAETNSISNNFDLKNGDPKEMRFCVKVFYGNGINPYAVELCSIMTNFEE